MLVIGLNNGELIASAAIFQDGKCSAGALEERFKRQKLTRHFPHGTMQYCLEHAGSLVRECGQRDPGPDPGCFLAEVQPHDIYR